MRGIREAAMGMPEEEPTPKYTGKGYHSGSLFDKDRYDNSYNDPEYTTGYTPPKYKGWEEPAPFIKGVLNITIEISNDQIGNSADINSDHYDSEVATTKATEIAYDYILNLAGKGFESKYVIEFDITEGFDTFDASITLTPITIN